MRTLDSKKEIVFYYMKGYTKMNKSDIVGKITDKCGISPNLAGACVETVIESITDAVAKGDKVEVRGLGTFKAKTRNARNYRNPLTGETILKEATTVPSFTPGKDFKDKCARSE